MHFDLSKQMHSSPASKRYIANHETIVTLLSKVRCNAVCLFAYRMMSEPSPAHLGCAIRPMPLLTRSLAVD